MKEGNVTQAPGAWVGGPGNFIPVVGAGDTIHITNFGPTGPGGAYEFTHRWTYNGEVKASVEFNVRGPRWRVYSSKNMTPEWTADWTVDVLESLAF